MGRITTRLNGPGMRRQKEETAAVMAPSRSSDGAIPAAHLCLRPKHRQLAAVRLPKKSHHHWKQVSYEKEALTEGLEA